MRRSRRERADIEYEREEERYQIWREQQDALEAASDYILAAAANADELANHLDVVTEEEKLPAALLKRAISLLNRAVDLRDAVGRLQRDIDKAASKRSVY